jgi:bisphosphoglycerate-dependent phosphoglycerate mutase
LQQYMNPYLQASLNPQLEEARRQAQITQMQNAAKMSSAGGFGGGRQAIMDAETQRNLGTNLANITGQGYNTAFNQAQTQFNADQARKIQEAQYGAAQGMTAAQLQAQFGLSADQANEASRQFGAQQKMTASQLAAQYGLSAQQATEASKQFGSQQGMTAAQLQAQYGLSADQANEMSRQFGAGQAMTASQLAAQFGLSADQATEASKQFGARFGLDANNAALSAAQTQGNLGALQNQTNLANINTQLTGGSVQRGVESEGVAADLAEFEKQRQFPYQQLDYMRNAMTGLPTSSVSNTPAQMSDIGNILSSLGGGTKVAEALGYKDVGSLLKKLGLDLGP